MAQGLGSALEAKRAGLAARERRRRLPRLRTALRRQAAGARAGRIGLAPAAAAAQIPVARRHRHRDVQDDARQHARRRLHLASTTTTSHRASPTRLCGGESNAARLVDEKWLLDLERKHFVALGADAEDAGAHRAHAEDRQAAEELRIDDASKSRTPTSSPPSARRSARRRAACSATRVPTTCSPTCCAKPSSAAPGIDVSRIDDAIIGCAMPEAEQGMNVARIGVLLAGPARHRAAA